MADPALTQIILALQARLTVAGGPNIFVNRDDSEPIQPSERPAKVIRAVDVSLDERMETGESAQVHAATIDIDHYADADMLDNISFQHNADIAETVALLHQDWTLGNLAYEMIPMSVTANADAVPESGVAILTLDVKFQTAFGDWTRIIF